MKRSRFTGPARRRGPVRRTPPASRPCLEVLEDRCLLSFSPAVSYPVGTNPQAVVTADFNHDGRLDLATVSQYDDSVSVLLGNGDGTFQPALTSATGNYPLSLAVGDFNADGKLDLATANYGYYDYFGNHHGDVSILPGNGDGTFQDPVSIDLNADRIPTSVAVGDFNGDGTMDLGVTSNYHSFYYGDYGYASVLLGNGDGSFSGPNVTWIGWGDYTSAVAANLNGDAFDDLVAVSNNGYVSVLRGDSSGYLQGPSHFYTGYYSPSVAAGDVNGDGHTDLVTANFYGNNVSVLLGNGAGSFGAAVSYAAGGNASSVVLGDFTGDGQVDVATANSSGLSVLSGRGDGTFSLPVTSDTGSNPVGVAAGDFNGDGWLDAATANQGSDDVSVLINDHSWLPGDAPSVRISDVTVTEGNTGSVNATFTVTLSAAYGTPITIHYATADGSATAGSDYTAGSGDVTFAAGQTTRTITVAVLGDRLPEPTESFVVNLTTRDAFIGDGQGVGTILDNEPRIRINNVSKKEGNGNGTTLFVFTVSLSVAYDQAVTVHYATADGTATTADHDYQAQSGTLTFAPGQTTQTITIAVYGDKKVESNETFFVNLSGASSNALLSNWQGIGTILDDDRRK